MFEIGIALLVIPAIITFSYRVGYDRGNKDGFDEAVRRLSEPVLTRRTRYDDVGDPLLSVPLD